MASRRKPAPAAAAPQKIRCKLLGIGGAGCNTIEHIAKARALPHHPLQGIELFAVNTDVQSLPAVEGVEPVQIGAAVTHGLGAGGEPEIGARAAQADAEKLQSLLENTEMVFLCAGLGGGTGTGAAPVVARLAKEQGALVLALVMMPFAFEGERRRQQAQTGLEQLQGHADAVIGIANEKLFKICGDGASVPELFRHGNELVATGVQAVWQLLSRRGLINLDFADLRSTLGTSHGEGLFSHGEAEGPDRVQQAVRALLENPLLDGGDALARSEAVLVSVLGGPDLTVSDVQRVVEPLGKLAARARLIMGAAIEETYRERIAVTVIAAAQLSRRRPAALAPARLGPMQRPATRAAVAGAAPSQPALTIEPVKAKQETLPLQHASRGRFDKSEPTLYEGEDLDVPTFIRRSVSLNR